MGRRQTCLSRSRYQSEIVLGDFACSLHKPCPRFIRVPPSKSIKLLSDCRINDYRILCVETLVLHVKRVRIVLRMPYSLVRLVLGSSGNARVRNNTLPVGVKANPVTLLDVSSTRSSFSESVYAVLDHKVLNTVNRRFVLVIPDRCEPIQRRRRGCSAL